jgi:RHS repeat-associated protein
VRYLFGFNGKENDNGVKGLGNQQDYGMRIYDPRVGRFLSLDPLQAKYPWFTPYQYAGNSPIGNVDFDGLENENYNLVHVRNSDGKSVLAIQYTGQEDVGLLDALINANKHPNASKLYNLYYNGQLIAQFESFQDLKIVTH